MNGNSMNKIPFAFFTGTSLSKKRNPDLNKDWVLDFFQHKIEKEINVKLNVDEGHVFSFDQSNFNTLIPRSFNRFRGISMGKFSISEKGDYINLDFWANIKNSQLFFLIIAGLMFSILSFSAGSNAFLIGFFLVL